jgi:outer membrane protein assembly factor BamE (lipoprotein component of BamABCDE complex)
MFCIARISINALPVLAGCAMLFMAACSSNSPADIPLDSTTWKQDKKGCTGKRAELLPQFEEARDLMMGMRERDILQVLGRPDKQDLHKRNQKFYIYYVQQGSQCEGNQHLAPGKIIRMRFSALDLVNEISYENI